MIELIVSEQSDSSSEDEKDTVYATFVTHNGDNLSVSFEQLSSEEYDSDCVSLTEDLNAREDPEYNHTDDWILSYTLF